MYHRGSDGITAAETESNLKFNVRVATKKNLTEILAYRLTNISLFFNRQIVRQNVYNKPCAIRVII